MTLHKARDPVPLKGLSHMLADCISRKSGWRCIVRFPQALHNLPASGKQEPIPEDISQNLMTNKKQLTRF